MKKTFALIALFAFLASPAFANIQISENGTNRGQFRKLNLRDGVTVDANGNMDFDDVVLSSASGAIDTFTVSTSLTAPNTVTAGARTGALPLFVGGVQGSPNKLFAVTTTIASGNTTSGAVNVTGITSAARCIGTLNNEPTVPSVYVKSVVPGSGTVTTSLSANPGASGGTVGVLCTEV